MEKGIRAFVPEHLSSFLRPGETGEILMVSTSGIYLRIGGEILLLCDRKWGVLPIGIGLEDFDHAVRVLRPQQGQTVTVSDDCLTVQGGHISLVLQALPWKAAHGGLPKTLYVRMAAEELAALRRERGISMLVQPLVLGQPLGDTLKQNPYSAVARLHLHNLIAAMERQDRFEIRSSVKNLLGLGLGLTPSADDVLLGMLYVFRALPQKCPETVDLFRESIAQLCMQHTNQISAAYLKAMIAGAPFERMMRVFRGICGEEKLDIQQLVRIGGSSGSEMLLGMLIALRICGYNVS